MNENKILWHQLTAEQAVRQLKSNASCGLSRKEARSRLRKNGGNTLFESERRPLGLLKRIITDPSLLLLLAVTLLSVCFSAFSSGIPTLILLLLWAIPVSGTVNWLFRARDRVRQSKIPTVLVLRNGETGTCNARNIVLGDVLLLKAGDIVPADCRLLTSEDLRVRFSFPRIAGEKREADVWLKQAQTVYPYGTKTQAPDLENMIYGGSEILSGSAKAIVAETGTHTCLGAMGRTPIPQVSREDAKVLSGIYPFLRLFGFVMLAWMLPVSIAALLLSPEEADAIRVFLPVCVLTASASAAVPYLWFHALLHEKNTLQDASVLCPDAIDRLPYITDLFLLGNSAFTDGVLHFSAACNGDGIYTANTEHEEKLQPLCEAFCLLDIARKRLPLTNAPELPGNTDRLPEELIAVSGYDSEALRVRLKRVDLITDGKEQILETETTTGNFRLCFTDRIAVLNGCAEYESADGNGVPLTAVMRENIRRFAACASKKGAVVTVVTKESGRGIRLLGVVTAEEQVHENNEIAELEKAGVRVRIFLNSGSSVLSRFETERNDGTLYADEETELNTALPDHYRVFVNFPRRSIASLVRDLGKKGRKIAVLTDNASDRSVFANGSVKVACGAVLQDLRETAVKNGISGDRPVISCAQTICSDADLLLPAVSGAGGGIGSFLSAFLSAREGILRVRALFRVLISFQVIRILTFSLSVFTGIGPVTAPMLFYASFFPDLAAFLFVRYAKCEPEYLRRPVRLGVKELSTMFRERNLWLTPSIPAIVLVLLLLLFRGVGILESAQCYPLLFGSMLLMQVFFLLFGRETKELHLPDAKILVALLCCLLLPAMALTFLSMLIPALGRITELGVWNPVSVILLLISPLLCLAGVLIFSGFSDSE